MLRYTLKRLGWAMITFFVIMMLSFILIKVLPVSPSRSATENALREALGYNKPIMVQFGIYLKNIVTKWDWGYSIEIEYLVPVWDIIATRLPPTIIINILSLLIGIPIGLVLGFYAAMRKNKWQDHAISTLVVLFIAIPSFIFAFLVLLVLCYRWQWFPMQLLSLTEAGGWLTYPMIHSMMPAVISMALGTIASMSRSTRAEICDAMTSDYILLARTKGLTRGQAVWKHALKNAMVPIFPGIVGGILSVFGGSMIIETIFGIPGIGKIYLASINGVHGPDYYVFLFESMFFLFIGLISGIIVDLSRGFLDPRIRVGSGKGGSY